MGLRFLPEFDAYVQWPVMLAAVGGYLLSIVALRSFMATRERFSLGLFMKVYNAVQVVLCAYMVYGFAVSSFSFANPLGLNQPFDAATEWFVFVHYASKLLDFVDTWIIVLKKNDRQLSFLHVYHHASILVVWGYLLQIGHGSGVAYFGAAVNSVIHLIMYSHFFYTSFGLVNPFKKAITYCQIVQFYLCLFHAAVAVVFEHVFDARLGWLQLAYHVTMLILFNRFFKKTYDDSAKPSRKGAALDGAARVSSGSSSGGGGSSSSVGSDKTNGHASPATNGHTVDESRSPEAAAGEASAPTATRRSTPGRAGRHGATRARWGGATPDDGWTVPSQGWGWWGASRWPGTRSRTTKAD